MRITKAHQDAAVERLARNLGLKLTVNEWHQHYSVYTEGERGSCQELIAQSNTRRDFVDQIYAANRALEILAESKRETES